MRPVSIIMGAFFALVALAGTVWFVRFDLQPPAIPGVTTEPPKPIGPDIAESGPYPKCVTPEVEHEFGAMEFGGKGSHRFVIRNEGEAPLKLEKGASTCQCTIGDLDGDAELTKIEVAPGGEVSMRMSWEIKSGPNYSQQLRIHTNDPDRKQVDFTVKGEAKSRVEIFPGTTVDFGDFVEDSENTREVVIGSSIIDSVEFVSQTFEPKRVVPQFEVLDAPTLEKMKLKGGFRLTYKVQPGVPLGTWVDSPTITARSPMTNTLELNGDAELDANGFKSENVEPPTPQQRQVRITSATNRNLVVRDARGAGSHVKVKVDLLTPDELAGLKAQSGCLLTATVEDAASVDDLKKPLFVEVDYLGEQTWNLNFSGRRSGPIEIKGPGYITTAGAVNMGDFWAKDGKEVKLSLFVKGLTEDLQIVEQKQKYNSVELKLEKDPKPAGKRQRYVLTVRVPPGDPAVRDMKASERVDLKLNHPAAEEMTLYVSYMAQ